MSPRPRLVVALVVGSLLAVFLAYQALFNSGTLLVSVAQLRSDADGAATKQVTLTGTVVRATRNGSPMRFVLRDESTRRRRCRCPTAVRYRTRSRPRAG